MDSSRVAACSTGWSLASSGIGFVIGSTNDTKVKQLWKHPQVRSELLELLALLPERVDHLHAGLLAVHARYTRTEILAAFDVGSGVKPSTWQSGVWWDEKNQSDLLAFTLDKSAGSFSPTTRYRDYAISPELIHWRASR